MTSTDIIPVIRTDHDVIFLQIGELENDLRGPGYWKMNCSLLADEEHVNSVTELIPTWAAEGRKELSDYRSVWDWIKYNIRAHPSWLSKKRSKERGKKELSLQYELNEAKQASEKILVTLSPLAITKLGKI